MEESVAESISLFNTYTGRNNPVTGRPEKVFTSVFIKKNGRILLGLKTAGLGAGLWNGFGGKVEENESIEQGVKRELLEESGLIAGSDLKQIGVISYNVTTTSLTSIVHVFVTTDFEGTVAPTGEMNPIEWFDLNEIPFDKMWPDAKLWYPYMLKDKYFYMHFDFDESGVIKGNHAREYENLAEVLSSLTKGN